MLSRLEYRSLADGQTDGRTDRRTDTVEQTDGIAISISRVSIAVQTCNKN